MSSDESSNATSDRRDAVREKAQQVQARQKRTHRIRTASIAVSVVAVLAITAVVVTWAVSSAASKPMMSPATSTDDGFPVTVAEAAVVADIPATATPVPTPDPAVTPDPSASSATSDVDIRVYVDYLSAGSGQFQTANSPQLSKWVTEGAVSLTYYPVAMLTAKSNGTKYSLRAASAAACVGTHSRDTFWAFSNALLSKQPDMDADGYSNSELADIAQATGAESPKVVRTCIESENYSTWAKGATERALKGIPDTDDVTLTGAPMVLVNGMPYVGALDDPKEFAQFVLTISSDAFYKEASASPTPTPTP